MRSWKGERKGEGRRNRGNSYDSSEIFSPSSSLSHPVSDLPFFRSQVCPPRQGKKRRKKRKNLRRRKRETTAIKGLLFFFPSSHFHFLLPVGDDSRARPARREKRRQGGFVPGLKIHWGDLSFYKSLLTNEERPFCLKNTAERLFDIFPGVFSPFCANDAFSFAIVHPDILLKE